MFSKSLFKYLYKNKIVNLKSCDFTDSLWKEFLSDDLQSQQQNEGIYKILLIFTISKGK